MIKIALFDKTNILKVENDGQSIEMPLNEKSKSQIHETGLPFAPNNEKNGFFNAYLFEYSSHGYDIRIGFYSNKNDAKFILEYFGSTTEFSIPLSCLDELNKIGLYECFLYKVECTVDKTNIHLSLFELYDKVDKDPQLRCGWVSDRIIIEWKSQIVDIYYRDGFLRFTNPKTYRENKFKSLNAVKKLIHHPIENFCLK